MSENLTLCRVEAAPRTELHDKLALTGCEVSVNELPAGAAVPFVHRHQENEELWHALILKTIIFKITNTSIALFIHFFAP